MFSGFPPSTKTNTSKLSKFQFNDNQGTAGVGRGGWRWVLVHGWKQSIPVYFFMVTFSNK